MVSLILFVIATFLNVHVAHSCIQPIAYVIETIDNILCGGDQNRSLWHCKQLQILTQCFHDLQGSGTNEKTPGSSSSAVSNPDSSDTSSSDKKPISNKNPGFDIPDLGEGSPNPNPSDKPGAGGNKPGKKPGAGGGGPGPGKKPGTGGESSDPDQEKPDLPGGEAKHIELQDAILQLCQSDKNYVKNNQIQLDFYGSSSQKLFSSVHVSVFQRPTFKALEDLFNAYGHSLAALSSPPEHEIENFLNAISQTGPYKTLKRILANNGNEEAKDDATFYKTFQRLWFGKYTRNSDRHSSGFRHVFVGEISKIGGVDKIGGLHNWIRMYSLENKKVLQYTGPVYIKHRRVPVVGFEISSIEKPTNSLMIGTSPEFDLAILTYCFLTRLDKLCQFFLSDCTPVNVTTVENRYSQGHILTAYASPWSTTETCPVPNHSKDLN